MAEPIKRGKHWWQEAADRTWLKWNGDTEAWERSEFPPPPPTEGDRAAAAGLPPVRSISTLGTWVKVLLGIVIAIYVIGLFSDLAERSLIEDMFRGGFISPSEAQANDERQAGIALLQLLILLVAGIGFIIWFHRAYHNVAGFGASGLPLGFGWAIGAWFVPIINLFFPKRIANSIWKASDPELPTPAGTEWRSREVPPLVHWWWGVFIASGFVNCVAGVLYPQAVTIEELRTASTWLIMGDGLSIVAGVLAFMVVSRITERQLAREGHLTVGAA